MEWYWTILILTKEYTVKYLTLEFFANSLYNLFSQKVFKETHKKEYIFLNQGHGYRWLTTLSVFTLLCAWNFCNSKAKSDKDSLSINMPFKLKGKPK